MLTLNDGRSELWQWDTGRKLTVDAECSQVHFSNKVFGRSIDVDVVDGIADIPDTLLQTDKELTAWAFVGTAENGYTKISKVFKVNKRNKPADYVFTEPDQTTLGEILGRIEDLENRPSGDVSKEDIQDAVNEYLDNNPVSVDEKDPTVPDWAKQPQKPTYTAAEVGALPDTTKIPSTAEDVGALPANAFIPKSATDVGAIPVPETATVGQTIVVKAVDENGKPTDCEAADMPGAVYNQFTLTEPVSSVEFSLDGATEFSIAFKVPVTEVNMTYCYALINGKQSGFKTANIGNTKEESVSIFTVKRVGERIWFLRSKSGNGANYDGSPFGSNENVPISNGSLLLDIETFGIKCYGSQQFPVGTTVYTIKGGAAL